MNIHIILEKDNINKKLVFFYFYLIYLKLCTRYIIRAPTQKLKIHSQPPERYQNIWEKLLCLLKLFYSSFSLYKNRNKSNILV